MRIYLDMDDVLVDFEGGLKAFNTSHDIDPARLDIHRDHWTIKQIEGDKFVVDCMNTKGFFRNLKMKEGADRLWMMAGPMTVSVLTAWPTTCNDKERVGLEKREWIEENFGQIHDGRFVYCAREDKSKYAASWKEGYQTGMNVLVDDMESNIKAWEKNGGIGILFKNMQQAVEDLNNTINKMAA
jgi:5'(3')-deoxyribonucleotidase